MSDVRCPSVLRVLSCPLPRCCVTHLLVYLLIAVNTFSSPNPRDVRNNARRVPCASNHPIPLPTPEGIPKRRASASATARARARNANSRERRREYYKLHGWMPASSHENKKIENNVTKLLQRPTPRCAATIRFAVRANLLGSLTTVGRVRCSRLCHCVSCQQTTTAAALWTLRSNRLCGRSGSCDIPRPRIRGVECLGPAQYQ